VIFLELIIVSSHLLREQSWLSGKGDGLAPGKLQLNSLPLPIWVIGGISKSIRPKLPPCASRSPILVPQYLAKLVWALE